MPNKLTSYQERGEDTPSTLGETLSTTGTQLKDKVSELGHAAADKFDENRTAAAGGLDQAASAIHDKAESLAGGETVTKLAHATAEKFSSTATYLRGHDVTKMMADVGTLVKNNPGPSILAAAAVGFLIGRVVSSKD